MSVRFVADCHIANHRRFGGPVIAGLNGRCRAALVVLREAAARCRAARTPLVVLGDLFDSARPEPQVVAAVQEALSGVDVRIMLGNHEMVTTAAGDHALGPLHNYDLIEVVEAPAVETVGNVDVLFVPFRPGRAEEWLPAGVEEALERSARGGYGLGRRPAVLCTHLGIRDDRTPPWLRDSPGSVDVRALARLCKEHGLCAAMAGDWHERRHWIVDGVEVLQVGALSPTGWDNLGMDGYGTLASFDPGAEAGQRLSHEVLPGPRFLRLRPGERAPSGADGCQLYVQVPEGDAAALESAARPDVVRAFEIVPDDGAAQQAAREAAESARSEDTLDGALVSFISAMSVGTETNPDQWQLRDRVLQRCRRYLAAEGGA